MIRLLTVLCFGLLLEAVGVVLLSKGIKEIETRTLPAFAGHKEGLTYGKVLYALGYALSARGDWKRGLDVLLECRAVMKSAKAPLEEAKAINHLAQSFLDAKNTQRAEESVKEARVLLDSQKIDPKSCSATLQIRNLVVHSKIL